MKTNKSKTVEWIMGGPESTGKMSRAAAAEIIRKHRKGGDFVKRSLMGVDVPSKLLTLLTRNLAN